MVASLSVCEYTTAAHPNQVRINILIQTTQKRLYCSFPHVPLWWKLISLGTIRLKHDTNCIMWNDTNSVMRITEHTRQGGVHIISDGQSLFSWWRNVSCFQLARLSGVAQNIAELSLPLRQIPVVDFRNKCQKLAFVKFDFSARTPAVFDKVTISCWRPLSIQVPSRRWEREIKGETSGR